MNTVCRGGIQEAPSAKYILDSQAPRDAQEADLCREEPDGGRKCIKVRSRSREGSQWLTYYYYY